MIYCKCSLSSTQIEHIISSFAEKSQDSFLTPVSFSAHHRFDSLRKNRYRAWTGSKYFMMQRDDTVDCLPTPG
jgi:hypothetical protein